MLNDSDEEKHKQINKKKSDLKIDTRPSKYDSNTPE